jgi:DNA polymerase-3 subunit delta|tara:strand:- start:5897 stop:6859 length:963 start_codon:yes stop_codon:yes gene_type:complete
MQEAADSIRQHFRKQGFDEREVFNIDKSFDWNSFHHATNNLSLFAEKKILELRFATAKLDDTAKKALHQYFEDPKSDFILLVSSPKLEAATLNTKWFKEIESRSALVQIWPVNREGLAAWLEQRLLQENIRADGTALQLLMDKVEGNLLAAMQEIEKLKLLAGKNTNELINLDANTVMQVVADSSRYSVYNLVDSTLSGELGRSQKILAGLRSEGLFPLVILNAFTREIRSLQPMVEKRQQGQGVNAIMQASRVWYNRKQPVGSALQRLTIDDIWQLLDHSKLIDQSIKGLSALNPWDEISRLMVKLGGKSIATTVNSRV